MNQRSRYRCDSCTGCKFGQRVCTPLGMGLTKEGRGHTLVVRAFVDIAHGMYLSVIRPSVKNSPLHRGGGMIMYPVGVLMVPSTRLFNNALAVSRPGASMGYTWP